MSLDEFIEKLRGSLIEVSELPALIFFKLNIRVADQHLANQNPRIAINHLTSVVRCIDKPFGAVNVDGCGWAA